MHEKNEKELLQDLKDLKKLMILQLLNAGVKQRPIARMLGISEATMSRMIPKGLGTGEGRAKAEQAAEA